MPSTVDTKPDMPSQVKTLECIFWSFLLTFVPTQCFQGRRVLTGRSRIALLKEVFSLASVLCHHLTLQSLAQRLSPPAASISHLSSC